jgi:hypothetical protein
MASGGGSLTIMVTSFSCRLVLGVLFLGSAAHAAEVAPEPSFAQRPAAPASARREAATPPPATKPIAKDEIQRLSFVENAYGASARNMFAGVSGLAISRSDERAQLGVLIGGSPFKRLTLHGLVGRDGKGRFAPSLAAQYALLGGLPERYALGALAQYKAEGFTEAGGEVELGALFSVRPGRFHLDATALFGIGLEAEAREAERGEGEADAEAKLRLAYDVFEPLRAGVVGRFRKRVVGERTLAGNKSWDFIGGAEVVASLGPCAVSLSGGPTTLGVADGVGAYGMLSVALFSAL